MRQIDVHTMADRIRTIAICIALFSIFTAAAGLTHDPVTFAIVRFIAGVGIGGVKIGRAHV